MSNTGKDSTTKTRTAGRNDTSSHENTTSSLAELVAAVLNHPATPAELYNAMSDGLADAVSDIRNEIEHSAPFIQLLLDARARATTEGAGSDDAPVTSLQPTVDDAPHIISAICEGQDFDAKQLLLILLLVEILACEQDANAREAMWTDMRDKVMPRFSVSDAALGALIHGKLAELRKEVHADAN